MVADISLKKHISVDIHFDRGSRTVDLCVNGEFLDSVGHTQI